jgi:hypothetical protein
VLWTRQRSGSRDADDRDEREEEEGRQSSKTEGRPVASTERWSPRRRWRRPSRWLHRGVTTLVVTVGHGRSDSGAAASRSAPREEGEAGAQNIGGGEGGGARRPGRDDARDRESPRRAELLRGAEDPGRAQRARG